MDEQRRKNRTKTVSFRLPAYMIDELIEECERAEMSPSVILRQILGKHLEWDRYRLQMNLITVPSCFARESMNLLSKQEIEGLAFHCASSFVSLALLKAKRVDLENLLALMEQWFRDSSIKYRRGYADGYHVFAIQHELGFHWSLFLAEFLAAVFTTIKEVRYKVDFNQNDGTVLFFSKSFS